MPDIHLSHVTTDKIKVLCAKNRETTIPVSPLSQTAQDIADLSVAHLRMYDEMFQTQSTQAKEGIA